MPAPYSDNMYSADDSDEDLDALSPTDGYFRASTSPDAASSAPQRTVSDVPFVPNVLVEDPTVSGSKAREAEEERVNASSRTGVSPEQDNPWRAPDRLTNVRHHHSHRRSVEEDSETLSLHHPPPPSTSSRPDVRTSLIQHPGEAPPAYTPSPSSTSVGYQTFTASSSTMGLPEEQQRLIPRGPESMGGPSSDTSKPPFWQKAVDCITQFRWRKKIRTILGALVVFSVIVALIGTFTMSTRENKERNIVDKEPVKKPENDDHDGDFTWDPRQGCLNTPHKFATTKSSLDLRSDRNLTIIQQTETPDDTRGWSLNVWGEVILRPSTHGSPGRIEFEVISNHAHIHPSLEIDYDSQYFRMITPKRIVWDYDMRPCIQIRITAWIPEETVVDSLKVATDRLDIVIKDGLVFGALGSATLHTVSDDVKTPEHAVDEEGVLPYTLDSRHIHIRTVSGDITGWYPLYDLLDLQTTSGEIKATVNTKRAKRDDVQPARLDVRTISGDVTLQEPIDRAIKSSKPDRKFPPRDYIVNMHTVSGTVRADVAFSSKAEFSSQSGDFDVTLWPILDSALLKAAPKKPELRTDTKSGDIRLNILEPLWTSLESINEGHPPVPGLIPRPDGGPITILEETDEPITIAANGALGILKSKHESISGDLTLRYPGSWEGMLLAQTISGDENIRGEGLTVSKSGSSYITFVRGQKGEGYSELDIKSVSGDQDVLIGREP